MRLIVGFTILSISWVPTLAQQPSAKLPTHEIAITVDNDYPYMTDQYYTAGQDLSYRFLLNSKTRLHTNDSAKTLVSIQYGNKLFTPSNVDTKDTHLMDRPYCGWSYMGAQLLNFKKINSGNLISFQVGMVGTDSGMGQLQQWWHKAIKLYSIEGWNSQISNEVVVNTNFNHIHGFQLDRGVEFVSNSGAYLGTGSNKISQELTLRLFRFNPLSQSSYLNASLSGSAAKRRSEFFFFASLEADYVFSNIFIEGSLFRNNPSPFTTSINPWLFTEKFGLQYAGNRISAGFALIHLHKETQQVTAFDYASASLAFRF